MPRGALAVVPPRLSAKSLAPLHVAQPEYMSVHSGLHRARGSSLRCLCASGQGLLHLVSHLLRALSLPGPG